MAISGLPLALALLPATACFGSFIQAQPLPAVTNLAQITRIAVEQNQVVEGMRLTATVFACDTHAGVMILQDSSGAELLELDGLTTEFQPGDTVRIESASCLLSPSEYGVYLSASPLVNNDGLHAARTVSQEKFFQAGRYSVRVDWFNQLSALELEVSCVQTNSEGDARIETAAENADLLHAVRADCFQGNWPRLPDFDLLVPVKSGATTGFDSGFRTRDEMVGIRFQGYFDAPRTGYYLFTLRSDDGSRLWVGSSEVPVNRLGRATPPADAPAVIGESMSDLNERRLVTIQGRVSFVSRFGKGLRFEVRSEQNSISVAMANGGALKPADLLNSFVRVSGVAEGVLTENRRVVLGRLVAASAGQLNIVERSPGKGAPPAVLSNVMEVQSLSSDDAARQLPVKIRGVVTAIGAPMDHWMAIQDETRGAFIRMTQITNSLPKVGELWSVSGHTEPGDFAPIVQADDATLIGRGRLPQPAHPTWNQLVNGSMDVQWVELQGLVTGVESNDVSLLLPEGRLEILMPEWREAELKPYDKAVVRIRGALFAAWNANTHEVRVGSVTMHNAAISVDKPAPADPFDAPEKTPRGLFRFDARATPFQRVKVHGQVAYVDSRRVFIEQDSGIEVIPNTNIDLRIGDRVEAVGYPEISGVSPILREALLRKTGDAALPRPRLVTDSELGEERFASMRIRVEGNLAGQHSEGKTFVLQIQTKAHLFLARVANAGALRSLRLGSRLSLTGICLLDAPSRRVSADSSHFELLVNGPDDVAVISAPSWWTLQRLLSVVGILLMTLALAAVWITQLRRQVMQRTLQLQHEIRERERAERQHALEAERSRIARDLHDDLGSSLTEINVLASTGQRPRLREGSQPALFKAIADKARSLISALDVIVWAVDPEDNSLQSLADYLSGYTREYLSNSAIACRFKIPVVFPEVKLDGEIRHELLMVVKETLNNVVRHADATEVEFQLNVADDAVEIAITDDGKGFDATNGAVGHGLKNRSARLSKLGGNCRIESRAGVGTTVRIGLPLPITSGRQ